MNIVKIYLSDIPDDFFSNIEEWDWKSIENYKFKKSVVDIGIENIVSRDGYYISFLIPTIGSYYIINLDHEYIKNNGKNLTGFNIYKNLLKRKTRQKSLNILLEQ